MTNRQKGSLTGTLLEGVLIVFAVLVALAVDEYWEGREEQELADVALERIAVEIRGNRSELSATRDNNLALYRDLSDAVDALATTGELTVSSVSYEVALLGADAWETARVTRAVHFMDFDDVTSVSEVYRIQQLYLDRQEPVVAAVAAIGGNESQLPVAIRSIRRGLAVTLNLECDLVEAYDSLLVGLPSPDPAPGPGEPLPGCDETG